MFAEIAPRYDFLNHFLSLNIDRYWRSRTLAVLNPKPGDPFLDVCTGQGQIACAGADIQERIAWLWVQNRQSSTAPVAVDIQR
ncbi:MAG: class I SAM-dependent methyltransferase [Pirellula sp.]